MVFSTLLTLKYVSRIFYRCDVGWVGDVLSTHQKIKPVDAFSFLPDAGDERPPNEHVFYDLDVVKAVLDKLPSDHDIRAIDLDRELRG